MILICQAKPDLEWIPISDHRNPSRLLNSVCKSKGYWNLTEGPGSTPINSSGAAEPSLLAGLIHDPAGARLTPTHAVKRGRRYRYYVSSHLVRNGGAKDQAGMRIPAHEIEALVIEKLTGLLLSRTGLADRLAPYRLPPHRLATSFKSAARAAETLGSGNSHERTTLLRSLLRRVVAGDGEIAIDVSTPGLAAAVGLGPAELGEQVAGDDADAPVITVPARLARRGGANRIIIADGGQFEREARPDPVLAKAVARAHDWFARLTSGRAASIGAIAREESVTQSYVARVMRLAFLAPDITEAILDGRQPDQVTANRLILWSRLPLAWPEQRKSLRFE
jgi:hypothetical protein